ncbi:type II toxin-antitoxin system HipA family toxin [Thalassiella azotivora]
MYKGAHRAATLRRVDGSVEFRYHDDHLERGGPPVATTLPLTEQPVVTAAGAVPPFFAGLLPEGRRLSSLRRAVKTSADDDLSLLLAVGGDTVGDVRVVLEGQPVAEPEPLVVVDRSFDEVTFSEVLEAAGVVDPVALAGVQDKASARVLSVPVGSAGRRYLLKVDPPEYPHVVENEEYFIRLARRARFPVVDARLVRDRTGRPGLLVTRFDRVLTADGTTTSLPVEDAAQALGIYPADKYAVTAEDAVQALARLCAARVVATRALFRQLCFAWLTGNGDVHAKNLSVLGTDQGEWRVSPAYDVPSTVPYGDTTFALSLQGRTAGFSRRHLLRFADEVGLPARAAERTLDDALAATSHVAEEWAAGATPLHTRAVRDLARTLRQRRRGLVRPAG